MNFVLVSDLVSVVQTSTPQPVVTPAGPLARQVPLSIQSVKTASNRRWSPRESFHKDGTIGSGEVVHRCVMRDLSKTGALLQVAVGVGGQVPSVFTLVFQNGRIRSEVSCSVRWRKGNQLGVSFIGPIQSKVARQAN
jgi:hypothetical protein